LTNHQQLVTMGIYLKETGSGRHPLTHERIYTMEFIWYNENYPTLVITESGWTPEQLQREAAEQGCSVHYVPTGRWYLGA